MATIVAARSFSDLSDNLLIVAYASNSVFQRFYAAASACGSRAGGGCSLNPNDAPVCPAFELDGLCERDIFPLLSPCNKLKLLPSSHTSSRRVDLITLHKVIEPTKDFYFYVQRNCYYFTLAIHLQGAPLTGDTCYIIILSSFLSSTLSLIVVSLLCVVNKVVSR